MAREQRRLAAILAADVVGYSRLMGRDESGTLVRLKAHRTERFEPALARRGGRLVKLTGDGALAEFPSAVDALGGAIEFQQAMAEANRDRSDESQIVFRIGLHLGDLIVDGDDLYGDGVNIAARLEGEAPAGGIVISGDLHNAVAGRLKATFNDLGRLPLKNIDRPVQAFGVNWEQADWKVSPTLTAPASGFRSATSMGGALALPDKPSIAVLPFQNMSGDPEQEYFADGMVEDIITALSRFKSLFVIARNSSFSYKGKSPDVREVGRELGVRYVLEGSVRKASNRIRVTAQLIEAVSGNHIWAERYDRVLEDIFAVQEEITRSIIGAIAPEIEASEVAMARRPQNLSAYELAVRANAKAMEGSKKNDKALLDDAIRDARAALAIDGESTIALNALSYAQWAHLMLLTAVDYAAAWREGIDASSRAIEVDRMDSRGYATKGAMLIWAFDKDRIDEALTILHHAHELNPYSVTTLTSLALGEMSAGHSERVFDYVQQALRVSPRDPQKPYFSILLSASSLCTGQYAAGVEYARQGMAEAPEHGVIYTYLAANLVGLGDVAGAREAIADARRFGPGFVERGLSGKLMFRKPEHLNRATTFLRIAAGLEEPSAAEAFR